MHVFRAFSKLAFSVVISTLFLIVVETCYLPKPGVRIRLFLCLLRDAVSRVGCFFFPLVALDLFSFCILFVQFPPHLSVVRTYIPFHTRVTFVPPVLLIWFSSCSLHVPSSAIPLLAAPLLFQFSCQSSCSCLLSAWQPSLWSSIAPL